MLDFVNQVVCARPRRNQTELASIDPVNYLDTILGASRPNGGRYGDNGLIVGRSTNRPGRRGCIRRSVPKNHLIVLKAHAFFSQE
jgi:hypothetical protein